MKKMTKRLKSAETLYDKAKFYALKDAISILKKTPKMKFDETVEISAKLSMDAKAAQATPVRGTVALPHGSGKKVRVVVFAKGEEEKRAREAGAEYTGADDLVNKIQGGWLDFDVAIATPDIMKDIARLGKVLGPRGLMPSPKSGTVTQDTAKAVKEVKAGKIEFKMDKQSGIHAPVGKLSFAEDAIEGNCLALISAIMSSSPQGGPRGHHVKSLFISTTMGPGIRLDLSQFRKE